VLWTDDGNRFGHSLWAGTLTVDAGSTPPSNPGGGQITLSIAGGSSTVQAGGTVTVTASGLEPGVSYILVLHSAPVLLGSAVARADGTLSFTGTIPADTPAGAHTITIAAVSDPATVLASVPLTVTAAAADPASLATTGTNILPWTLGGVILLLLGAGALTARRMVRRRSA
jgi:hypothetical protein